MTDEVSAVLAAMDKSSKFNSWRMTQIVIEKEGRLTSTAVHKEPSPSTKTFSSGGSQFTANSQQPGLQMWGRYNRQGL